MDEEPTQSVGTGSKPVGARKGLGCEASLIRHEVCMKKIDTLRTNNFSYREWVDADGNLDRKDGPAFERSDGAKIWFLHGNPMRQSDGGSEMLPGYEVFGGVVVPNWDWRA